MNLHELEDELDEQNVAWVQRLARRAEQPGVVRLARARETAVRLTHLQSPPLADEVARRYAAVMALQQQLPPIVYATPAPPSQATSDVAARETVSLPIVTAKPVVETAESRVMPPAVRPSPQPQSSDRGTAVPSVVPTKTTNLVGVPAASRADDSPLPTPKPTSALPLPVVKATSHLTEPFSQADDLPVVTAVTGTAVNKTAIPLSKAAPALRPSLSIAQNVTVRPSDTLATSQSPTVISLPVVQATAPLPAAVRKAVPAPQSATPVVTASPLVESKRLADGRAPLPTAHSQESAPTRVPAQAAPLSGPPPQPLPLAQPTGGVIQRAAQGTAVKSHSVKQPPHAPQPTPTSNRVVQANPVVQRMSDTAVSSGEENDSDAPSTIQNIDVDELVEKVHRRFLRRLAVEGERRGKTVWP